MEKRNQVCLSAAIMYAVAGFAGYINEISNYWIVLVLSFLAVLLVLSSVLFDPQEVRDTTKIEWISAVAFFAVEIILTMCIEVLKLPYVGFFGFFNLTIQSLGLVFIIYAIVKSVISYTGIHNTIKEFLINRKTTKVKTTTTTVVNEEIATKVEEAIAEETTQELVEEQETVYDFTEESEKEPEVIGIELREETEIATPYMEEEM